MPLKAVNIKGGMGAQVSEATAVLLMAKAPEDLIPQMQALNLLENNIICST